MVELTPDQVREYPPSRIKACAHQDEISAEDIALLFNGALAAARPLQAQERFG
ncbi:hypothetical protein [Stenotrophomonas sp.]|uniref:hypothetical protein n=1 Tax=Stenotrophomonas sp. TaxID=69392 RepID=UPI0028A052FC|nr:hypothetical protein [Stenotrophomonas sp.]